MQDEKFVDESWKDAAVSEKEILAKGPGLANEVKKIEVPQSAKEHCDDHSCGCSHDGHAHESSPEYSHEDGLGEGVAELPEVNFVGYVTSLAFQSMIFLGEIPNPMTNETEKNLPQAKFLIDTLVLLREKTKNNLDAQESNAINGYIYELQLKYVEAVQKEEKA